MDLTRFDFHVVRFMSSETVQEMTAEEVGQFILLLCNAWLLGKDATLPDNPKYLARTARSETVSELVLSKFPILETEHGPRRRNDILYKEWLAAKDRSESAAKKGRLGGRGNTIALPQQSYSFTAAKPNPNQSKPIRSKPDQTESVQVIDGKVVLTPEQQAIADRDQLVIDASNQETLRQIEEEKALAALSEGKPW